MTPKRDIRPSEIVDCAIEVLAQGGFAHFSVLKVARAYGIRQSHLGYYFPTRDDLVAAMATRLADRYQELVEPWCREAMARPGNPMAHIIGRRSPEDAELTRLRETTKALLLPAFDAALQRVRLDDRAVPAIGSK